MNLLDGVIVDRRGRRPGTIVLEDGRIGSIRDGATSERLLLPGFVDLHVHGGDGADVMDGAEGIAVVAAFHLRHGTTALCPTTVTRPPEELRAVVAAAAALPSAADQARVLGVHLEGPFLNDERRGAQPPFVRDPDLAMLETLLEAGPVATVTLAPELPGALELIPVLRQRGVRVSLGHSNCTLATAEAAFAAGASGVTHLFNAMSGTHHRKPGLATAALEADDAVLELILDLIHVHPAAFRLAHRSARGRLALVTDAIRAAGVADGVSELGGQEVRVKEGRATLPDGTLAGSVLTLDQALRNAVDAGLSLEEVTELTARTPADALGREDLGRLEPGAWADVLILDPDDLSLQAVVLGGRQVDLG